MGGVAAIAWAAGSLMLLGIAAATLWMNLEAWRSPGSIPDECVVDPDAPVPPLRFSLLLPARHETAVLADTLARLVELDHPDYEIVCIVGHDDPETAAIAEAAAAEHPALVTVVTDYHQVKNKPKALNTGLGACTGQVIGVIDAEDEVATALLRAVAERVAAGADVVQAGVQLMNYRSSWWAVRNVLEYYLWFRSRLHFQARTRFVPLGGNSVFVRADLLRSHQGWDDDCLTEDCDLGVRLSVDGAAIDVIYEPALATREETPGSIGAFIKQRTRWNQGFLQVLRKGDWRKLPTWRARALALFTLAMPFLQAAAGLLAPLAALTAFVVPMPVALVLLTFAPLVLILAQVGADVVAFREFCHTFELPLGAVDVARIIVGTWFFYLLLAVAALRASAREIRGQTGWEKTGHANLHRITPTLAPEAA